MTDESANLLRLATDLLAQKSVDWSAAAAAASSEQERALIRQLQGIANIAHAHRYSGAGRGAKPGSRAPASGGSDAPDLGTVGGYRLLERIGESGFAVVYRAERDAPDSQTVALKLIKWELDLVHVGRRLEQLQVNLGRLPGPGIARILDTGVSSHGRVFVVSQWVPGVAITTHCQRRRLGTDEKIELFTGTCAAIEAGHEVGLLHRGIKPGNILIDPQAEPTGVRVLDFGIAAAAQQRLTEWTLLARYGRPISDPAYISPDELLLPDASIDARADVYSLGALLFELLAGDPPFEMPEPRRTTARRLRRIIVEDPAPSPESLGPYRGIVARALAKDRSERFASAGALARAVSTVCRSDSSH